MKWINWWRFKQGSAEWINCLKQVTWMRVNLLTNRFIQIFKESRIWLTWSLEVRCGLMATKTHSNWINTTFSIQYHDQVMQDMILDHRHDLDLIMGTFQGYEDMISEQQLLVLSRYTWKLVLFQSINSWFYKNYVSFWMHSKSIHISS